MDNIFNPARFINLIKREEAMQWRSILLTALTLGGVTALLTLLASLQGESAGMHRTLFTGFLFVGGYLTASGAFKEMHMSTKVHDWLMLPASSEEKFLARLLISSLGYWIFISIVYFCGMLIGELLSLLISGQGWYLFNPFGLWYLRLLPHYLITQSVFIAGGAFFRKHQFLKTVLFLSMLGIVLGFFTALLVRFVFGEYFNGSFNFNFSAEFGNPSFQTTRWVGEFFFKAVRLLYHALLAPFCWLTAYLRVREAEVRYAL